MACGLLLALYHITPPQTPKQTAQAAHDAADAARPAALHTHLGALVIVLNAPPFRNHTVDLDALPMPFEEVSAAGASQLDHAALEGDDVELWLIRCPPGFDPSELHDRKVDLTREDSTPIGTGSQATGYCLRPIPRARAPGLLESSRAPGASAG